MLYGFFQRLHAGNIVMYVTMAPNYDLVGDRLVRSALLAVRFSKGREGQHAFQ